MSNGGDIKRRRGACGGIKRRRGTCGGVTVVHAFSVDDLPSELLEMVMYHSIKGHDDVGRFAAVCVQWRKIAADDGIWKLITLRGWGTRYDIIQFRLEIPDVWMSFYKARLLQHAEQRRFLLHQPLLTVSVRAILINWMLTVIDEYKKEVPDNSTDAGDLMVVRQRRNAIHTCVAIIDRYFGATSELMRECMLQTVGAACVLLALHRTPPAQLSEEQYAWGAHYTAGACDPADIARCAHVVYTHLLPGTPHVSPLLLGAPTIADGPNDGHFEISRADDTSQLDTSLALLGLMGNDNVRSRTFNLTQYFNELALQVHGFFLPQRAL